MFTFFKKYRVQCYNLKIVALEFLFNEILSPELEVGILWKLWSMHVIIMIMLFHISNWHNLFEWYFVVEMSELKHGSASARSWKRYSIQIEWLLPEENAPVENRNFYARGQDFLKRIFSVLTARFLYNCHARQNTQQLAFWRNCMFKARVAFINAVQGDILVYMQNDCTYSANMDSCLHT